MASHQQFEYLKFAPSTETLKEIITLLGVSPRDLMRKKESAYSENNLGNSSLSDKRLIALMVKNPILIERPIVLAGGKAVLGRPPSQVVEINE